MREISNEMRQFLLDLQVFAGCWIDEVQSVILKHVDELFADEAVRFLVKQYADEERRNKKSNEKSLLYAYEFGYDKIISSKNILYNHKDALYQLCYKRYVDKEDAKTEEVNA